MDRDCPAYLSVGTDVSAKYRGAFCEAKVKTTTKHVKCKINFKGLSSAIVSDEFVNGTLKVGAAVNAKHPEQGTFIEGVITKLTDVSTYTVVFDDGDEKTLRRSSLCLQGERHFNESETLDHLPLTDPENFGTPVVRDAKKRKKRKPIESDEEQAPTSASPSARKRTGNNKGSEDVGKVVIVELNEKKKNSWFPALVIHPKRTKEVSPKNKDNLILKSFKDNKIHNIAKNSTKSFTSKDHVYKGDNNSLKAAVGRAVSYIETGNLPTNWDSGVITEEDFLFESDDEVDSDDDSDEDFDVETDAWLASLYKFMEERGTPINKPPVLGYQDLNLFKLFKLVQGLGGCRKVTDHQKWREISFKMGIPVINSSSHHNIKASYTKYLHAFEEYNRKLGPGLPGPLTRTTRRRSSFERPTLSPIRPRATRTADEDGESDNEREPPMLKRRVTITEIEEEVEVVVVVKKSERQNKKDDKQKKKDVKIEESDKEDDTEEKNVTSKASEQKTESKAKNKDTVKVDNKEKEHTEVDETDENQSQETDTDYQFGEKIKVLYGRGRTQKVYEAKIIEIDVEAHWHKMYRVHYVGWNIRHDEWIGNNRIVGSEDRVKLRKKQKQDKEKEREKKVKEKEKEEKERLQQEEKERIQKENEKLLKDKKEKERQEKEKERLEKERIKKEKEKLEKEKKERHEKEIREKERLEREREKQEKERKRKEKVEQEKKAKEEERRLKELEIAESLENKKKEKKDEKGKGKSKPCRSKEERETLNTDKGEKEDQAEVERPKTPGKRGRPSLKSNTTPTARSNSVTRKVPSPVSSKSTKSTRTRRSDRNSLSESPFAAGLNVKPRTRKSSIHSDTKLKQDDDSESETSNSIKDEEEKAEEIKDAEDEHEETPVEENEDIKIQVEEKDDEKEDEKEEEKEKEDNKQVEEEPIKENEEIKEEIVSIEIPVADKEVITEQKHVEELVEIMMPKGKERKKEKKEGKSKKKKDGKGKKDKKVDITEQSEESFTTTAPLESNSGNQDSVENVKNEEEKTVVNKKENEEERPKKDTKSEGKKSRKRRRSKSLSERKAKETADVDNKDKEEDIEFKQLSFSRFKEEEGAAALMDIYNPRAAVHEKLECMAQTSKSLTPPTTPENSPPNPSSPADQSIDLEMGMQHDEPSNRSDSDGMIDVAGVTDVQSIGNQSPHCDASVSSNTSGDSVNGIAQEKRSGSSKKRRRTISGGDTPSKRKRRSHKHSSHHEKKKRHSKEPVRHSSSDTDDTSNNDMKTTAENLLVPKTPEQNGKHVHRPGRTPKYNFRVDLTNIHDPEERISIIQQQLDEMRKIYMSLKNEVASIDRRRKKLRRKEREGKAAAALTISSDRRTSDRHSNDTS